MQAFTTHTGIAAPLLRPNIDTDAIIPSREMRRPARTGLGSGLFANWRYRDPATRETDPEFVLNHPAYAGASLLFGGANFGCGSSREQAVWALVDFGIRAIMAPSFGAIFHKNCIANGLLPARVEETDLLAMAAWVADNPGARKLTIDLAEKRIRGGRLRVSFEIGQAEQQRLLKGLDSIAHTLQQAQTIDAFEQTWFSRHPWAALEPEAGQASATTN